MNYDDDLVIPLEGGDMIGLSKLYHLSNEVAFHPATPETIQFRLRKRLLRIEDGLRNDLRMAMTDTLGVTR